MKRIETYAEFWPFYLQEHSVPLCRALHFVGTGIGYAMIVLAVVLKLWWLAPAALLPGYAFAWVGHFFVEKNKPASFKYPLWSFVSDHRMWWLMAVGKLWTGTNPAEQVGARQPASA